MFNKLMQRHIIIVALVAVLLSGCATLPEGPNVLVLPAPGKDLAQFQSDDYVCRQWAGERIGVPQQEAANRNTATGAVVGTAIGTGVGALLGAISGHAGAGAAIGAGSGLLVGTVAGTDESREYGWAAQRKYDYAYVQCMYAKGNQIPGQVHQYRIRRISPSPPDMSTVPPDYVPNPLPVR